MGFEGSKKMKELFSAVSKMQSEIKGALKDSKNPFFKSNYADLGSVWDAARGPLVKNGLCIIQTTDFTPDGMALITTLGHVSGESIRSVYPINPTKNDPQGIGSAITYARRYSMAAILGIYQTDDDAESSISREVPDSATIPAQAAHTHALLVKTFPSATGVTDKQRKMIWAKAKGLGLADDAVKMLCLKYSGKEHSADWTRGEFENVLTALEALEKQKSTDKGE